MLATQLPAARRERHERAREWPQAALSTLLAARVAATPERPYMIDGETGRHHSFRSLQARAGALAANLVRLGIRPGDVVSWQLPNWVEAAALAVALDHIGAVSSPIITMYREREVGFICRQTRARALVVPGLIRGVEHRDIARAARAAAPDLEHILTVRAAPGDGMRALDAAGDAPVPPASPPGPHDVSMVFYTSGTTADPKGVLHTRSTLGALVRAHQQLFSPAPADRGLLQFPLPHVGGILLFIASQIVTGSSVVFLDGFDPGLAMRAVDAHGVTGLGGPPAALRALLSVDGIPRRRVATLRTVGCGAADVSPELMREVERAWGVVAYRSYGMTECPMFSSGRPGDPVADRHDTDGRPLPGCTARIVDGDGRPLGPNREGEVELFGPQLCGGYLDPALNEAFTPDGFLRSGDLGILDDAGCLRITGRRKDVIIRKGETLSARDIEDVLAGHPAVADVAAIGLPDPERGERVCACLVLRSGHTMPSLDEVGVFMAGRGVMRQKIPEQIEWMAELPRNATGKVLKSELRARVTASR